MLDSTTVDNPVYCHCPGINIPFAVGELVLGLEAFLVRDWRTLQLVAHAPVLALGLVRLDMLDIIDMDMAYILDMVDNVDIDRCTGAPRSPPGGC